MIDSHFRAPYQKFVIDPVLHTIDSWNISPQMVTGAGLALGLLIPAALYLQSPGAALALLIATGFMDTLDGSIARMRNCASPQGAALDIVSDRVVETAIIYGLYSMAPEQRALGCLLMLGSILICVTSFLVVGIFERNQSEKSFHYSPGIMERTEAFIAFGLLIMMPEYFVLLSSLFSLLVLLTGLIRIRQFIQAIV